ncbi:MAG: 2-hydroxyacid dehydrogenase [Thermoplasmata archaeon]
MKTLVTFRVNKRQREIGERILGKENVVWYPETAEADVLLIRDNNFPHNRIPKLIQAIFAGIDHIDLHNIPLETIISSNAGAYSIPVAEHVFALIMDHMKKISKFRGETFNGIFKPETTSILYGKSLGVIGYGGIGSRVAHLGQAFGMKVIAIGRSHKDRNVNEMYSIEDLEKLLKQSDIIVVSLPLTTKTLGLIGANQLTLVKRNSILVNIARPEIVVREDMLEFLSNRDDFSYLTDVWWDEPQLADSKRENVTITPHVAGSLSEEALDMVFEVAFMNIKRFVDGGQVENIVRREESVYIPRQK